MNKNRKKTSLQNGKGRAVPEDVRFSDWNQTKTDYPENKTVPVLFREQAARTPDATAVTCGGQRLTYRELDRRSTQLATYLGARGIGEGNLVGIFLERSEALVVGLLGVLKAGAAYLPLDPHYPTDRLLYMFEDTHLKYLLAMDKNEANLPDFPLQRIIIDRQWPQIEKQAEAEASRKKRLLHGTPNPDALAYVIFTSGSTGNPKGVRLGHRSLTNFLCAMAEQPGCTGEDRLMALTTICFDIAGLEIYLPLITGAQVDMVPGDIAGNGHRLKHWIEQRKPTMVQATPSTWQMLESAQWKGRVNKILCGGEALSKELAQLILAHSDELWNMYGPTETTIWSSVERVQPGADITIGRPIANTQFYILDENNEQVPVGQEGELYIGGHGLALG